MKGNKNHQSERNDPTWKLLGNASKKVPSESFTQDLIRSVRIESAQEKVRWWQMPTWKAGFVAAAAACIIVAVVSLRFDDPQTIDRSANLADQTIDQTIDQTSDQTSDQTAELSVAMPSALSELGYRNELLVSAATPTELDDQDLLELLVL